MKYLVLILSLLMACGAGLYASLPSDDFTVLDLKTKDQRLDVRKVFTGRDYFVQTKFDAISNDSIKSIVPTCACIQILAYSNEEAESNLSISFTLKTIRERKFKVYLDVLYTNGTTDRLIVVGESLIEKNSDYINPKFTSPAKKQISKELYIGANRLVRDSSKYFFADLRTSKEYFRAHISGSRNVRLIDIQTNDSLKSKTIILVLSSVYSDLSEIQCKSLRSKGFKNTFILLGGIQSWQSAGGKLSGVDKPQLIYAVSPDQAYKASRFQETVFVGEEESKEVYNLFPDYISLSKISVKPKSHFQNIICLNKKVLNELNSKGFLNASYISTGVKGYKDLLLKYSSMASPASVRRQTKLSNCEGCP